MIDYSRFASEYAKHRQVHPGVLEGLISDGGVEDSSAVLEVGCGTGNYLGRISQLTRAASYGIDPSEQMLSVAKARLSSSNFSIGKAEKLEFGADYFDLVFTVDAIHHIADLPSYFQEAYRVLKNGARVCTVTDSMDNPEPQTALLLFPGDCRGGVEEVSANQQNQAPDAGQWVRRD